MGFKIESIATMTSIANNLSNISSEAKNKLVNTTTAVDEIVSNVKGQGVDTTLNKLRNGINSTGNAAITLLNDISTFISTQTTSYTTNEETVVQELKAIDTALEGLEV